MSQTKPFGGQNLLVRRKNGSAFDLICMASTKSLSKTNEFDDATVIDCEDPTAVPFRRSVKKRSSWAIGISGTCDGASYVVIEGDCDAETAVTYQFENARPLADGGGIWEGAVWYENLEIMSDENGIVKWKGQLRGDGPLVRTPAVA